MGQKKELRRSILTESANEQMRRQLHDLMPAFTPPTDAKRWPAEAERIRQAMLDDVMLRGVPKSWMSGKASVHWGSTLRPTKSYVIRKLRYEAAPDYWIPALLYEPRDLTPKQKAPVVINPNGHHSGGKAADYKQIRCANLARRGMIALNFEFIGMSELEADSPHDLMAGLQLAGVGCNALFYLAMKRGLDVLLEQRNADKTRVCATGLSGGGWQTIVQAALDPRITAAVPVAGYTAMRARVDCERDIGDLEQDPPDMATVADYDVLTAMVAPRPMLQIHNETDDCCFRSSEAKPVIHDAVRPTWEAMGAGDAFRFYSNHDPGTHNYDADNRSQLYRFLNDVFQMDTPEEDLHHDAELYSEVELAVGLPESQETVTTLARRMGRKLANGHRMPRSAASKDALRAKLRDVIRLPDWADAPASSVKRRKVGRVRQLELTMGPWRTPMTIALPKGKSTPVRLVVTDDGRLPKYSGARRGDDYARCEIDLLTAGELRGDRKLAMMLEACGQRVLGIQTAQVLAAAAYLRQEFGVDEIDVWASGAATPLPVMIAAALKPHYFNRLLDQGWYTTMVSYIDRRLSQHDHMGLFCSDLLTVCDIPQIKALMTGVNHEQRGRCLPDECV